MPLKDTNCRNAKPQDKPYRLKLAAKAPRTGAFANGDIG